MTRTEPTEPEKRDAFNDWYSRHQRPYIDAVIRKGGHPWSDDLDERYALWCRRYERPAPCVSLPERDLSDINESDFDPADLQPTHTY